MRPVAVGEAIRRYGQVIGFATAPIPPGTHVHTHNCGMGDFDKDYAWGADARPTPRANEALTFQGHPPRGWPRGHAQTTSAS